MRLATVRRDGGTVAARISDGHAVPLAARDVGELLLRPSWREVGESGEPSIALADVDFAPVIPHPAKVICVGLNYRSHIEEMGREAPAYPTLFTKFAETLIGAHDRITLPSGSQEVDWEVELAAVVGTPLRRADETQARAAIAGYTVLNDVSMRDWQWHTTQWLPGKAFEATTPVGPWLTTPDEVDHAADLELRCEVDGEVMQRSRTSDLVFNAAQVMAYVSQFTTLRPGDIIATGTPGGVGSARNPKVFLRPGQVLRTVIDGLGECVNECVKEEA